jgi:hypothetical protein
MPPCRKEGHAGPALGWEHLSPAPRRAVGLNSTGDPGRAWCRAVLCCAVLEPQRMVPRPPCRAVLEPRRGPPSLPRLSRAAKGRSPAVVCMRHECSGSESPQGRHNQKTCVQAGRWLAASLTLA